MQSHQPYAAEFRVLRPDGSARWVAAKGKFYYSREGDPERMLGMAVDITERKQADEVLRTAPDGTHRSPAFGPGGVGQWDPVAERVSTGQETLSNLWAQSHFAGRQLQRASAALPARKVGRSCASPLKKHCEPVSLTNLSWRWSARMGPEGGSGLRAKCRPTAQAAIWATGYRPGHHREQAYGRVSRQRQQQSD